MNHHKESPMPALKDYPREYLAAGFDPSDLEQIRQAYAELALAGAAAVAAALKKRHRTNQAAR